MSNCSRCILQQNCAATRMLHTKLWHVAVVPSRTCQTIPNGCCRWAQGESARTNPARCRTRAHVHVVSLMCHSCVPWSPMETHRVPRESHGSPWGPRGSPWVSMGNHGSPWVPMGTHGPHGSPCVPHGVPVGPHGSPWGPHGFPWPPMFPVGPHGIPWDPRGFP